MRNFLLTLLFIPFIALGQSSGDGIDINLDFKGTTAGENDITRVQINDTIILALNISDLSEAYDVTYIHTDVEYNTAAYTLLDPVWMNPNGSSHQNNSFEWSDTKWSPNPNYDKNDLWAQWSVGGGSYNQVNGWNVGHYTTQDTGAFAGDYIELHFIVKDADVANYAEAINVTMAKVDDNINNHTHAVGTVRAHPVQSISNVPLEDFDNNVYLKVEFSSNVDPTKIKVDILKNGTVTGTINLDAAGEANVTDYINSSTDDWSFAFNWDGSDQELSNLLDNAVTISDVTLALKEVGEFEHGNYGNAYEYGIQYLATDFDANSEMESSDSYKLLAHVLDVSNVFVETNHNDISAIAFAPESIYNSLTFDDWQNQSFPEDDGTFQVDLSNGDVILPYSTAVYADANLSHGVIPDNNTGANATSARSAMAPGIQQYGETKFTNSSVDANLLTELRDDGNVYVEVEILGDATAALQLKLNYDTTRLSFKEIVFDTGNTTTNFGNANYNRVNMGSINQNGAALPANSKFIAVFEPITNISSAAGLVTIVNVDAADTDGLQQILNIQ